METLHLVLNAVTVIFISATMFSAGLGATVPALRGVFANVPLLLLALITNMVGRPAARLGCSHPSAASPSPPPSTDCSPPPTQAPTSPSTWEHWCGPWPCCNSYRSPSAC
ncbi:hypothetical protein PH213_11680 [Streptomyces sp. SRF1]|uniref:hypothetical protein n=1 Tax=Streptomyces sp. SRF1 TaxID=1549642 RepID=UPI0025AFABF7|nr:hypothetical protein [Streptomyces sp. SRF1]MDN3055192.1 hypothetical protein [Streptomyces sp. SRF1]